RSNHFKVAMFFVVVAAAIWVWFILVYIYLGSVPLIGLLLGLACAASMPWVIWRFLRNTDELMVGVFLLLCCTIASIGSVLHPPGIEGWLGTLVFPLYSLLLLGRGIQEHLGFRHLVSQLRGLEEG